MRIAVLHGPNLNLLGQREPEVYGSQTLEEINEQLTQYAHTLGLSIVCLQSNHEGVLVDWIQQLDVCGFVINAAGYTHTSVALRDALLGRGIPFVEVHMSNIFAREEFRHKSFLSDIAVGIISGFGTNSYVLGINALYCHVRN